MTHFLPKLSFVRMASLSWYRTRIARGHSFVTGRLPGQIPGPFRNAREWQSHFLSLPLQNLHQASEAPTALLELHMAAQERAVITSGQLPGVNAKQDEKRALCSVGIPWTNKSGEKKKERENKRMGNTSKTGWQRMKQTIPAWIKYGKPKNKK